MLPRRTSDERDWSGLGQYAENRPRPQADQNEVQVPEIVLERLF